MFVQSVFRNNSSAFAVCTAPLFRTETPAVGPLAGSCSRLSRVFDLDGRHSCRICSTRVRVQWGGRARSLRVRLMEERWSKLGGGQNARCCDKEEVVDE